MKNLKHGTSIPITVLSSESDISENSSNFENHLVIADRFSAAKILGSTLSSQKDSQRTAAALLDKGAKSVLLTGVEEAHSDLGQDYWASQEDSFWLSHALRGEGSKTNPLWYSAIAKSLEEGHSLKDAIVIGKMVVNRSLRGKEEGGRDHAPEERDIPYLSDKPLLEHPKGFKRHKPGFYPIVDSSLWVKKLLDQGVRCMQLRIKNPASQAFLEKEIEASVVIAKQQGATLFINDYWKEALKVGATAIHLGQEDLQCADIDAIREQGLLLGLSTHCHYEVARAHAFNPSYMACGPIYRTDSKEMAFAPLGVAQLQHWRRILDYPLVAIGGINLERLPDILGAGVEGVSVISAITKADDPDKAIQQWLTEVEKVRI